jgi:hypothetical protein
MLSGWGVSAADSVLYTLLSGMCNVFARLGLPVIAVVITTNDGPPLGRPARRRRYRPGVARHRGRWIRPHPAARALGAPRGTAVRNLALWLVLLASVRGVGLTEAQVPWATSLAAFAFARLLTVLPVTPGGAGITE